MIASASLPNISHKSIAFIGLAVVFVIGVCASVTLILATLWLFCQVALALLQAVFDILSTIATTFIAASPDFRLIALGLLAYILYRVYHSRQATRKEAHL